MPLFDFKFLLSIRSQMDLISLMTLEPLKYSLIKLLRTFYQKWCSNNNKTMLVHRLMLMYRILTQICYRVMTSRKIKGSIIILWVAEQIIIICFSQLIMPNYNRQDNQKLPPIATLLWNKFLISLYLSSSQEPLIIINSSKFKRVKKKDWSIVTSLQWENVLVINSKMVQPILTFWIKGKV